MRLATVVVEGSEELTIVTARGLVPVADINREMGFDWPARMGRIIRNLRAFARSLCGIRSRRGCPRCESRSSRGRDLRDHGSFRFW